MMSFRIDEAEAARVRAWAERLGIDRSELIRDAVRRHLVVLAGREDGERWMQQPLDEGELALAAVAEWGPAEEWTEWAAGTDAAG